MPYRVTQKRLQSQCDYLNRLTGNNPEPWRARNDSGRLRANIGTYYINYDYNQPQLQRMMNSSGGCENVLGYRGTKGEVDRMLGAFIKGIEVALKLVEEQTP